LQQLQLWNRVSADSVKIVLRDKERCDGMAREQAVSCFERKRVMARQHLNLTRRHTPVPLERLEKRLFAYACAAGAAGVGTLALVQPAEAKIIYTSANVSFHGKYSLDLNHDGVSDFVFYRSSLSNGTYARTFLSVDAVVRSNRIWGTSKGGRNSGASDLKAGVLVGPKGKFNLSQARMASWFAATTSGGKTFAGYYGPWANGGKGVKNRYVGLKFMIRGKVHFGWARVTVTFAGHHAVAGTLTGYAYETIPNKAIVTGKTKGTEGPTVQPATLGHLARGASAIPVLPPGTN